MLNYVFIFLIIALSSTTAFAADINLTIHQQSANDTVTATIQNNSAQSVDIKSVYIEFSSQKHAYSSEKIIPPQEGNAFNFTVKMPSLPGSYPLIVTVRYLNDSQILTLRHVGLFNFQSNAPLNAACSIEDSRMNSGGDVIVRSDKPEKWKLILPEELQAISAKTLSDKKVFHIRSAVSGFKNAYPVFAIAEEESEGFHKTEICSGMLTVDTTGRGFFQRGRAPSGVLLGLSVVFLLFTLYAINKKSESIFITALGKYAVRMFFISVSYYLLKNLDSWLETSLAYINFKPYEYFAGFAIDNLRGGNYQNFFHCFVDVYFALCLLLTLPYLFWLDREKPLSEDKYTSLLRTLLSIPILFSKRKIQWNSLSRLGMLTILLKLFFVPIMVSWLINNILHIKGIISSSSAWNLYSLNAFLTDFFILMDTGIFAFGYLVESRLLRNEIKSVDPTFLGWLVCLWCYPPFNAFSFKPFDYQLIDIAVKNYPEWIHALMICAITFLWGIFVWASVALGFKASNLTNRGIIASGPYRFVRHPAYTAKVLIWIIQGVFFGQFYLGILLAFTAIYLLRAWTEERHLSMGQDYIEYKQMVKWRFVPYLI